MSCSACRVPQSLTVAAMPQPNDSDTSRNSIWSGKSSCDIRLLRVDFAETVNIVGDATEALMFRLCRWNGTSDRQRHRDEEFSNSMVYRNIQTSLCGMHGIGHVISIDNDDVFFDVELI